MRTKGIEILIKIFFPNLKILKLENDSINKDSILFFQDKMFSNLIELDLNNNYIGDILIENIDKCNLTNLSNLNISNNEIFNNGLKFFSSDNFKNLKDLNLSNNQKINDLGIEYLKNSKLFNLKNLNLEHVYLNYKGLDCIVELPFKECIDNLALYLANQIKYEDIPKITEKLESKLKNLKKLKYLRESMENLNLKYIIFGYSDLNRKVFNYLSGDEKRMNNLATIGMDKFSKVVIRELKIKVNISFWITTGKERFRSISKSYYKGADALVLCFDMNGDISFNLVKDTAQQIINDNVFFVFCSNNNECSPTIEVEEKVKKCGRKIFYFNDKNKKGIDDGIAWLADKFTK